MKCKTPKCKRSKNKSSSYCNPCRYLRYVDNDPVKAAYVNLKKNAKRRGKFFDLTFKQFKKFAIKVDLLGRRGRTAQSYTVDRIDNEKGYTVGNIQMLTLSENVKKMLIYDYRMPDKTTVVTIPKSPEQEYEF